MESLSLKNKYIVSGITISTFLALEFGLGPKALFGLTEPVQYLTHQYFGVGTATFDYALIASLPTFAAGISINQGNTDLKNIVSNYFKISIACLITFILGLLYLYFFHKPINPLIPQYLIVEPFNSYSMLIISAGIFFSILLLTPKKSTDNGINKTGKS